MTRAGVTQFTHGSFGTYAWSDGKVFLDNVRVINKDGAWTPDGTYYWPKSTSVDFVCYYPQEVAGKYLTVEPDKLTFENYDVAGSQLDIMYADKAVGYFADGEDVPALFRHALAKVNVIVSLAYEHATVGGVDYDWKVNLNSISLEDLWHQGRAELYLQSYDSTPCTVEWTKPENAVWTPTGTKLAPVDLTPQNHCMNEWNGLSAKLLSDYFVLPQALQPGGQKLRMSVTIETRRNGELVLSEDYVTSAQLYMPTFSSWKMNQNVTYSIVVTPTRGSGVNPADPDAPVDPHNPDLSDAYVTFDPAVDGWSSVEVSANIAI